MVRGVAVWGKVVSTHPKILDLCRGIDTFFKESDSGVLQIPGEYETAIWYEGGKFYIFHPWPADLHGNKVGLREGGKACVLCFKEPMHMCDHFLENAGELKRKAFSVSDVQVFELKDLPESVSNFKRASVAAVAPNKWVMRGTIHEGDAQFPPERRNKQGTPVAIMALAMAHVREPEDWMPEDIDDALIRGDILYQQSLVSSEEGGGGEGRPEGRTEGGHENAEEEDSEAVQGLLAAADVLNRFKVSDFDCIQTEVAETAFYGSLQPDKDSGLLSLSGALEQMFKEHTHAVMTARYSSTAIWKHEGCYYYFDSHACDEFGYPSEDPRAAACLVRINGSVKDLASVIEANLAAGSDNSFNISPMEIIATKLDLLSGAPETKLESKAFEWIRPGAAAILMGPRGENTAIGKAATRAAIAEDDMAGRTLALPAAAMFVAAAGAVPPTQMHQDHMYNFLDIAGDQGDVTYSMFAACVRDIKKNELVVPRSIFFVLYHLKHDLMVTAEYCGCYDICTLTRIITLFAYTEAGAEYYLKHVKRTGCSEMTTQDLNMSFEFGANTCVIELKQPYEKPLKIPEAGEGGGEEEGGDKEGGEGEEEPEKEQPINEIKDVMTKFMNKPNSLALLVGDFHILGIWCDAGGKVVAFDPSPTLPKGVLTSHRITRGDELAKIRAREMLGEGAEIEEDENEEEGEGGPPEPVPLESAMALMVYSSPYEFTARLSQQGGLDNKRCKNPYKLYPVVVTNELTALFKDKADTGPGEEEGLGGDGEEGGEDISPLDDSSLGKYFIRMSKSIAAVRGRVAQHEGFFIEKPNRDNQDVGNAMMAIVVEHIESYDFWKPTLLDAILKYGDRLYTTSLPNASEPPLVRPEEVVTEFNVTQFTIRLEVEPGVVTGDLKAGDSGSVLNLKKGINAFLENYKYGILCTKRYCVALWRATDEKSMLLWEPHAVGPTGRGSPSGACALLMFSTVAELAETYKFNIEKSARPGSNK
ncbi:hypothetical protein EVAR_35487_1 [Eumeta japonica]|uniref:Uncharacterized protein n=1 Tax=Eumeta variegata TaxID=151549 RepID=A0A4C1X8N2_EUMVA|nr:hypothetical protein EVAR_35487_1 [Eumeta japonica]